MLEELWPDLGNAFAAGLLAGGASVAIQWAAHKAARPIQDLRARCRRNPKGDAWVERDSGQAAWLLRQPRRAGELPGLSDDLSRLFSLQT